MRFYSDYEDMYRIAIFADKRIKEEEELTLDYVSCVRVDVRACIYADESQE